MGILIDGVLHQVPGVNSLSPDQEAWVHLSKEDFTTRLNKPQQAIIHKTVADDLEHLLSGVGPSAGHGGTQNTAEFWQGSKKCSGAQLITGFNGEVACLEDIVKTCAWHGNQANYLSYGHEMKEVVGGGCYEATYAATVATTLYCTRKIGIQWQCPDRYRGPLQRFVNGGTNLVGIFGHRDITSGRNRHDPGDYFFELLAQKGCERFDFMAKQDLDVWSKRQEWLKAQGVYAGVVDGVPGPKTTLALLKLGYPDGIYAAWRECAERPPMPPL